MAPARTFLLVACVVSTLASASIAAQQARRSPIRSDEEVLFFFFPTAGVGDGLGGWTAEIHGWIFERERDWSRLAAFERFLQRTGLQPVELSTSQYFRGRSQLFLVDNERNKRLSISIDGSFATLAPSTAGGHIRDRLAYRSITGTPNAWISFQAVTRPDDTRLFSGAFQLIPDTGISVVSDLDDTIKESNVLDTRELMANTFLREFRAVAGMADIYRTWEARGDTVFHYVSGSPWQLYPALSAFLTRERFPAGTFEFRPFRLKDRSGYDLLGGALPLDFKIGAIERLMRAYPRRRFAFVGDSGENDPEVYSQLAVRYPDQVVAILIRDVTGEEANSLRHVRLLGGLPPHIQRRVFRAASQLTGVIAEIVPRGCP